MHSVAKLKNYTERRGLSLPVPAKRQSSVPWTLDEVKDAYENLGDILNTLGISQHQIARETGEAVATVCMWANKKLMPKLDKAFRLFYVLRAHVEAYKQRHPVPEVEEGASEDEKLDALVRKEMAEG